ncbi:MAG: putative FKBP-type peptidyl-prolyl cis-trans isomerase [Candidatus Bathyarchaeota archaeon BA2]|nr:MAG: putative FKBP-type peptidyl-prolyl cis-trans isomerase [Candidatus Bathyarchaeota archaeon BA2]
MPSKKGDFILINYTSKVKETGEIFDTTIEETAKKEKLYKEGEIYEPQLIVVGEGWMLKAVDEALPNLKIKKKDSIEVPPEKAFGPRDPEKVRLVPLRRLTARGITPQLGMRIEYNKKPATIRTIGAGRVQLDFNPPLAGKTLIYEITVQKNLKTKKEKIAALIHRRIPAVETQKIKFKTTKTNITINMPEEAFYLEGIQPAKRGVATDIQKFFPEITTVKFTEIFKKQETGA